MTQEEKLIKIKELIKGIFPESRIIVFGSRYRGDFNRFSDYDLLVIFHEHLNIKEKRTIAGMISNKLGEADIPADVIVKTEEDIQYYQDKIGSLVREVMKDGISL